MLKFIKKCFYSLKLTVSGGVRTDVEYVCQMSAGYRIIASDVCQTPARRLFSELCRCVSAARANGVPLNDQKKTSARCLIDVTTLIVDVC